jgi:hypothetical protein
MLVLKEFDIGRFAPAGCFSYVGLQALALGTPHWSETYEFV